LETEQSQAKKFINTSQSIKQEEAGNKIKK